MRSQSELFIVTALFEVSVGLSLIFLSTTVIWLLLGVRNPSQEALIVGRILGGALISIGIACWLARYDRGSLSQRALTWELLLYNGGAFVLLAIAGSVMRMSGIALWPGVVFHMALALWCATSLRTVVAMPDG